MQLPVFLQKAINDNTTSLGDHPSFPPEDDDLFVSHIVKNMYSKVMDGVETNDRKLLAKKLNELVTECKKEEEQSKEALEQLCSDVIAKLFDIPEDTIDIDGELVDECDMSMFRMVPESTPDFEFEDIDEIKHLTDVIYQRRMIDCLISGIAMAYAANFDLYPEINNINPRLTQLYYEILKYNMALLYNQPDSISNIEKTNNGCVIVKIGDEDERISVEAKGVIFPILLEFTIRGLLEVAAIKGLPDDQKTAEYIMGKADYRLAENWDMRLGVPLWNIIGNMIEETGYDTDGIGANFIVMELSKLEPDMFNSFLQNTFKKTRKGIAMMSAFLKNIEYMRSQDDFDNYIQANNDKYQINDSEYSSEELLSEITVQ